MGTRIIIADDHKLVREGLRSLIEKIKEFDVVAEMDEGSQAVDYIRQHGADLCILDITMPNINGIEASRQIKALRRGVKVIILSMHSDKRFITQAFEAGSDGYLLKESAFEELALAIKTVMAGRRYLGKQISEMLANEYLNGQKNNKLTGPAALSPREREVLQQLAEGKSTKQVAFNLGLSVKTVETYRQKIMEKTGIETIAGLTKYAIKEGLTGL